MLTFRFPPVNCGSHKQPRKFYRSTNIWEFQLTSILAPKGKHSKMVALVNYRLKVTL